MRFLHKIMAIIGIFSLISSTAAHAEFKLNLSPGVTPVSRAMYDLHMTVFWICVGIAIVVFSVMIYTLIYHRKSRGVVAAQFHEHTSVEIIWAIIPFLILIAIAIPATRVLILMDDHKAPDINIKVTGSQWKWHYDYLDDGISFTSNLSTPLTQINNLEPKSEHFLLEVDRPLVVPINKKIRFLVTSNDVIHSWWVQPFGVKRDAIPGFIHESWTKIETPGTYRGQCAELCGVNHGFMPIVVEAKTEEEYQQWINSQKADLMASAAEADKDWTKEELLEKGEKAYLTSCAACHQPTGLGMPPTFPALKGSQIATGPLEGHLNIVLNGKAGTAMQAFGKQLSETDLAAIITYERNAWGNNTGDVVQPKQIRAAKGGASAPVSPTPANTGATPAPAIVASPPTPTTTEKEEVSEILSKDALMKKGEEVYLAKCSACHKPDGTGMPPTFPSLKDSAMVNGSVAEHIDRVLNGKAGTAMVAFGTQLNDTELAAVITYERNSWNGGKGTLVQPEDIEKARKQ